MTAATTWSKISMPWFELDGFADLLVEKINFLDVLNKFDIEYSRCPAGDFTHKLKCPFPIHDGGNERTASLYISEKKNNFFCFGCSSKGSIIDFVSIYRGCPYYESQKLLAEWAGINFNNAQIGVQNIPKRERLDKEKTINAHVFRTGMAIKEFVQNKKGHPDYNSWCKWADLRYEKLDLFMNTLENDKWQITKSYYDKIINYLNGVKK